jgi:hypothetical protein
MIGSSHIIPPPELVGQWRATPEYANLSEKLFLVTITTKKLQDIATQAAQWGADQELEACCEWLDERAVLNGATALRTARRPKPPSLKEQALDALRDSPVDPVDETLQLSADVELIIRRALEALDD